MRRLRGVSCKLVVAFRGAPDVRDAAAGLFDEVTVTVSGLVLCSQEMTPPPDPGRSLVESVRLSFLFVFWVQGPVSGAPA